MSYYRSQERFRDFRFLPHSPTRTAHRALPAAGGGGAAAAAEQETF